MEDEDKKKTTKKKTSAKKKATTKKKTTSKATKETVKKENIEPAIKEETLDDVDIVFHTVREGSMQPIDMSKPHTMPVVEPPKEEPPKEIPKKKKKKYRLKKNVILYIILGIIIIDALFVGIFILVSNNKKKNENKIEEKASENKNSKEEKKEEPSEMDKERAKYDLNKLKQLNDIDTKIDFFKYDNLDRYLAYKEKNPTVSDEMVVVYVNIGLDNDYYTNIKNSPNVNTEKVITNKYYALASDYEPDNLISVSEEFSSGNRKMVKEAAEAFNKLASAAKGEGYNVRAVSTYRSYTYQRDLYNRYAAQDGVAEADTYSARPGHSEHQTGLAVDVDNSSVTYTSFGDTKEFNWMKENAYKYGYILRYTKDNEWITGYKDEPWHYRYVGEEIAKYIKDHPMTYEEYFVRFLDK